MNHKIVCYLLFGCSLWLATVDVRAQTAFVQQAKLLASDGAAQDSLGFSAAISGDTALLGSLNFGSYLFERSGASWGFARKLTAPNAGAGDTAAINGGAAILGDAMIVGSTGAREQHKQRRRNLRL